MSVSVTWPGADVTKMARTLLLVVGSLALLMIVAVGVFLLWPKEKAQKAPEKSTGVTQTESSFPEAHTLPNKDSVVTNTQTGGVGRIELPTTIDGRMVAVRDFTVTASSTAGTTTSTYSIVGSSGGGATSTAYTITYSKTDTLFTIFLLREPLGASRAEASEAFLEKLGITIDDACLLPVAVYTAPEMIGPYAGKNLGLAFCTGALTLPI